MSSPYESLIVDWVVNSFNTFIEEIRLSLVTLAISPCGGEMVESRDGEIVECLHDEMECCDDEMVEWIFKPIVVKSKVDRPI